MPEARAYLWKTKNHGQKAMTKQGRLQPLLWNVCRDDAQL